MRTTRREEREQREDTVNKNLALIVVGALVCLALVGGVVLHVLRPDTVAAFMPNVITLLGLMITAVGTIYGLGKINEKVDGVHKNTNGTLSALREENDRLTRENVALAKQVPPDAP